MTEQQVLLFLQALGAKQVRTKGNWVTASCPLAPWLHKHHVDSSPSFGISVNPGAHSRYHCFTCQSGSVEELLQTLELYAKGDPAYDFLFCHQLLAEELEVLPLPAFAEFQPAEHVFEEWPAYWIDSFKPVWTVSAAYDYLTGRGVSEDQMNHFGLRADTTRHMVVAPYWDVFHRFAGARGRSYLPNTEGPHKHFDYSWKGKNNAKLVWYNEIVLNVPGPAVVVEGQFDCWRVARVHFKTLANFTAKPTFEKMKKLADCPYLVQIPDRDEAGHQSTALYVKFCAQLGLKLHVVQLDEGCKDPAECHLDYLADLLRPLL